MINKIGHYRTRKAKFCIYCHEELGKGYYFLYGHKAIHLKCRKDYISKRIDEMTELIKKYKEEIYMIDNYKKVYLLQGLAK